MDQSGLVPVRVRDCACPDRSHDDGDVVYLVTALGLEGGAMAEFDLIATQSIEDETRRTYALLAKWTVTFVRYGAVAWNFTRLNDSGKSEPVPFDVESIVSDYALARPVAEKANELYSEAVMRPLFELTAQVPSNRAQRRSQRGRTGSSTSPRRGSTRKPSGSSSPADSDGPQLRIAQ